MENVEFQLSELDMIRSMFPGDGELVLDDPSAEQELRFCLQHQGTDLPIGLSYRVILTTNRSSEVELHISMGQKYPTEQRLRTRVQSNAFSRESQSKMNRDLERYLEEQVTQGELAAGVAVAWVQENWQDYALEATEPLPTACPAPVDQCQKFTRLWIYSHHIYSKTKRKNILDLAPDHGLTGFCMPGKPGIICLEGLARNCIDAWSVIKSWNWKKINVKIQEEEEVHVNALDKCRRFTAFEEIGFVKNSDSRDYHMDMGEFFAYLKRNESEYMFKELFGINKVS